MRVRLRLRDTVRVRVSLGQLRQRSAHLLVADEPVGVSRRQVAPAHVRSDMERQSSSLLTVRVRVRVRVTVAVTVRVKVMVGLDPNPNPNPNPGAFAAFALA